MVAHHQLDVSELDEWNSKPVNAFESRFAKRKQYFKAFHYWKVKKLWKHETNHTFILRNEF